MCVAGGLKTMHSSAGPTKFLLQWPVESMPAELELVPASPPPLPPPSILSYKSCDDKHQNLGFFSSH